MPTFHAPLPSLRLVVTLLAVCGGACGTSNLACAEPTPAPAPAPAPVATAPAEAPVPEAQTLLIGDKAPALSIAKWVKGSPVDSFEAGKVYIVEFWATWCGPCRVSIPHLTSTQKDYKDRGVTVIGISSQERNGLDDVEPFVKTMGDKMDYTVAWDDSGKSGAAWMEAAGLQGIPSAFIINQDGKIAWMGHPLGMDKPLAQIVAKTYDLDKEVELAKRRAEVAKKTEPLMTELQTAMQSEDTPGVLATMDKIIAIDPEINSNFAVFKIQTLVEKSKDFPAAFAYLDQALTSTLKNNGDALTALAGAIVENPAFEGHRDLKRARAAAERASVLAEQKDPQILDTLAKIAFKDGDVNGAIGYQEQAIALVTEPEAKAQLETRLVEYKKAKPAG